MSATPFVIIGLVALAIFVLVQIWRTIEMVRDSNIRKQRLNEVMEAEQARMEVLKRQADEAANAVLITTLEDPIPKNEFDQKAA